MPRSIEPGLRKEEGVALRHDALPAAKTRTPECGPDSSREPDFAAPLA